MVPHNRPRERATRGFSAVTSQEASSSSERNEKTAPGLGRTQQGVPGTQQTQVRACYPEGLLSPPGVTPEHWARSNI